MKLRASFTLNRSHNGSIPQAEHSPNWTAKASASAPLLDEKMLLAGEMQLIGARSYSWNGTMRSVPTEALLNVSATFPDLLLRGMQAQLRLGNLFNRTISHTTSPEMLMPLIPQNGRDLSASLRYEF